MYRCQKCGKVSGSGEPAHKTITETRQKEYSNDDRGRTRLTYGTEIVKELTICTKCAEKLSN